MTGQRERYLREIDALYSAVGYSALSTVVEDYRLCKLVWLTARRERPAPLLNWLDRQYLECLEAHIPESLK